MSEPVSTIYMPNGQPVPEVMLEIELIELLRMAELGIKNPHLTLRYYREKKLLDATRIGNRIVYSRENAIEFLKKMSDKK